MKEMLMKKDSKLSKDNKNMAVLVLLMTQPQNLSLHNIPVNNHEFIRDATQNKSSSSLV